MYLLWNLLIEKALLEKVENFREHVLRETKPEIARWARENTPEIDDIQIGMTVSLQCGAVHQEVVDNYEKLFEDKYDIDLYLSRSSCARILVKGGKGMGESILCKKIMMDWAEGKFSHLTYVFYISLKLMNPRDVIEKVIIDQSRKLDITPEKLRLILERDGHKCLIIFDGLEKYMVVKGSDLMDVLKEKRFKQCSVLLTLDTEIKLNSEIDYFFLTECEVQGFGPNPQRSISKIVDHQSDVESILKWKTSVPIWATSPRQPNPMLAMFLCVLVRNNMVKLENNQVTSGEVIYKLV